MAAERNAANGAAARSVALDVPTGLRVYDEGVSRGRQSGRSSVLQLSVGGWVVVVWMERWMLVVGIGEMKKHTPRVLMCILPIDCQNAIST